MEKVVLSEPKVRDRPLKIISTASSIDFTFAVAISREFRRGAGPHWIRKQLSHLLERNSEQIESDDPAAATPLAYHISPWTECKYRPLSDEIFVLAVCDATRLDTNCVHFSYISLVSHCLH